MSLRAVLFRRRKGMPVSMVPSLHYMSWDFYASYGLGFLCVFVHFSSLHHAEVGFLCSRWIIMQRWDLFIMGLSTSPLPAGERSGEGLLQQQ